MGNINIAELLKNCPQGMELDCTMYSNVQFMEVDTESDTIILRVGNKFIRRLNKYGQDDTIDYAKCVIFPKGKTTWEGFHRPYINGDTIVDKYGAIALYKRVHSSYEEPYVDFHCGISSDYRRFFIKDDDSPQHCGKIDSIRLATEEEKQKLFDAIKENGYKWNAETKTLEKLVEPHFKVGDRIKQIKTGNIYEITKILSNYYITKYLSSDIMISFNNQDEYELVSNKFDINTLKPFDKVLVRYKYDAWHTQFFEKYDKNRKYPFVCMGNNIYEQCIPYEGNEHLLYTTDDCNEYFKIW